MREIKFRAWRAPKDYPHIKEMHYFDMFSVTSGDGSQEFNTDKGILYYYEAAECPLMQYLGLKDKQDVEIYAGDIVDITPMHEGAFGKYKVAYSYSCWVLEPLEKANQGETFGITESKALKVIGNVFENPELLGGAK